jgi:hypothetical protein
LARRCCVNRGRGVMRLPRAGDAHYFAHMVTEKVRV